jgi:hypothetical protein
MASRKQFRRPERVIAGVMQAQQPEIAARRLILLDRLLESDKTDVADVEPAGAELYDFLIYTTGSPAGAAAFRPGTRGKDLTITDTLTASGTLEVGVFWHQGATASAYGNLPVARPVITGSRGGNAALASLLTGLATIGWVTDNTTV